MENGGSFDFPVIERLLWASFPAAVKVKIFLKQVFL